MLLACAVSSILASEKSTIFQKFYRVGNEDVRKTKGTGLGLFIVKHIVENHNATQKFLGD